jgi:hypothetical protein
MNDPIREYQSKLKLLSNQAEFLRPTLRAVEDAIERSGVNAVVVVGKKRMYDPQVEIAFFAKRLDESVPLLRELAKEGLKTDKDQVFKDELILSFVATREYNLGPSVILNVFLINGLHNSDSSGPTCRMEQVGVKEVPIFEMKCD